MAPWITVLPQHTLLSILSGLQIHFCVIIRETRHHAQAYVTLHALVDPGLSLPRVEQRRQRSCVDFAGQCWLWWLLSCTIFAAASLGLPIKLGVGQSWLFPASSIKFLTRRSLKSRWVYWAPHECNRIQLLNTVRSRRWKNSFVIHLRLCQSIK